jgi:formylglycine-generating enzyme required for sulfatase activity
MTENSTCPDRHQLQSLLSGALPDAEQDALTEHIEACESCQKTLDVLAANSREEQARHLGDPPAPPEPGLEQVMRNALGEETQAADTPAAADETLAFLAPPGEPGHLGRLGHYEVLELVGQGGFGLVFKAFDEKLQRIVAIKVLAPELAVSATARKRFVREARAAAAVRDDHVVAIHEVNDEHSPPYLVMEFIAGVSLQDRLDRDGPLEVREILRIGLQTAEGLAAAHKQGLVHRDIKPGNILLENGVQRVKITDFGLARAVDDASLSQSGVIAGTPMYMSPEQAQGEALDHRSDLFSLGSVLFAMCTGRPPFRASGTMAVLKRVCEEMPRSIREINPEVPERLCDIIAKLHAKQPEARFQSAHEVADVLGQHLADIQGHGRGGVSGRSTVAEAPRTPQTSRPRRRFAVLLALAPLLALIAFGIWWFNHHPSAPADPTNPTPAADNDGWVQLFNGTDLTGWKVVKNTEDKWSVEQNILVGRVNPRDEPCILVSDRDDYQNFHFRIEAMTNADADDGGQCFRFLLRDGRWKGYEAQIQHEGNYYAKTGSLLLYDFRQSSAIGLVDRVNIKGGEWFTQEVIAQGNHLSILLNGKVITNVYNRVYDKGHLALMAQLGTVRFRKVEVKELPADKTEESAATSGGTLGNGPPLAVAPFDEKQAKQYQDAWAKHLGVPVEITNAIGMKLRLIPPGEFLMGSPPQQITRFEKPAFAMWGDGGRGAIRREGPQRKRVIAEPFYLGTYEVTAGQFRAFVKATKYKTEDEASGIGGKIWNLKEAKFETHPDQIWSNPAFTPSDNHPVVFVTRKDAEAFCACLSKEDGRQYVLPRTAQWEFACRAGTATAWSFGDDESLVDQYAWFASNSGGKTQPVGLKAANAFALYDMHGNAEEIVIDENAGPKEVRVCGGDARLPAWHGRSASVNFCPMVPSHFSGGFRVAIVGDLKPKAPQAFAPFVILARDGKAERKFAELREAVKEASDGDTLEVRDDGPFVTDPVIITRRLTLRAADGFKPVLRLSEQATANNKVLLENTAPLVLEGLDLRIVNTRSWAPDAPMERIILAEAPLQVANCRFTITRGGDEQHGLTCVQLEKCPACELRNCLLLQQERGAVLLGVAPSPRKGHIHVENCLLVKGGPGVALAYPTLGTWVVLKHNTIVSTLPLVLHLHSRPELGDRDDGLRYYDIETSENILTSGFHVNQLSSAGKALSAEQLETAARRVVRYHESRDLHSLPSGAEFLGLSRNHQAVAPSRQRRDLPDWERFWSLGDTKSLHAQVHFRHYDAAARPELMAADDFRLHADSPGKGAGTGGRDLGADVDRVGPGKPYEEWKKTDEYKEWAKKTEQLMMAR